MAAEETLSYYLRAYDLATPVFRAFGTEVERTATGVEASMVRMNQALAAQSAETAKLAGAQTRLSTGARGVERDAGAAGAAMSGMGGRTRAAATEIERHENALRQAGYGLSGFSGQLGPFGRSLDTAAKHAQLFRSQGIDYIAAGLVGAGAAVVAFGTKVNLQFDALGKQIQAQAGTSSAATKKLLDDVKKVGTEAPASWQQIAQAVATQYKLFGDNNKQIQQNTDLFLAFAERASRQVQPAIVSLSNVMRQFHPAGMSVVDVMNQMVTLAQNTQQPLGQYLNILDKFGPSLHAMGLSFTDTIGLFKAFSDHGVTASMMGRGLASAMSMAEKQIKAAQAAVADGGAKLLTYKMAVDSAQISVNQLSTKMQAGKGNQQLYNDQMVVAKDRLTIAEGKLRSYTAAMKDSAIAHESVATVVGKELKGIEDATTKNDALNLATQAFGNRLGPQMAAALWHVQGGLTGLDKSLGSTKDSTSKLADTYRDTLHGQLTILGHDFDLLTSKLGFTSNGLKGIVHDVGDVVKVISEIPKPVLDLLAYGGAGLGAATLLARHTPIGGLIARATGAGDVMTSFLTRDQGMGAAIARGGQAGATADSALVAMKPGAPGSLVGAMGMPTFVGSMRNPLAVMVVESQLPGGSAMTPSQAASDEQAAAASRAAGRDAMAGQGALFSSDLGRAAQPGEQLSLMGTSPENTISKLEEQNRSFLGGLKDTITSSVDLSMGSIMKGGMIAGLGLAGGQILSSVVPGRAGSFLGGAATGAGIGAGVGSIIPGLGTVAGGLIGGAVGGISSLGGGTGSFSFKVDGQTITSVKQLQDAIQQAASQQNTKKLSDLANAATGVGREFQKMGVNGGGGLIALGTKTHQVADQMKINIANAANAFSGPMQSALNQIVGRSGIPAVQKAMEDTSLTVTQRSAAVVTALQGMATHGTGPLQKQAKADLAQLVQSTDSDFGQMMSTVQKNAVNIKDAVSTNTFQAYQIGTKNFSGLSTGIANLIAGGAEATAKGLNQITQEVNDALKAMGEPPLNAPVIRSLSAAQLAAVVSGQVSSGGAASPHFAGGKVETPMYRVGEEAPAHPEYVLATNPAYRNRNIRLWAEAGKELGIMPGFRQGGVSGGGAVAVGGSRTAQAQGQYVFPFPKSSAFTWERIDQGQDLEGPPGGPVIAIGPGNVSVASDVFSGFGPHYPVLALSAGPWAGRSVYYGHSWDTVTGSVTTGEIIGKTQTHADEWTAAPAGWLEFGFTSALGHGIQGQGAEVAPMLHALAAGHMVAGTGGVGGVSAPVLVAPKVRGGGAVGTVVQGGLNDYVKAVNKKLAALAPASTSAGFAGSLTGPVPKQVYEYFSTKGFNKVAIAGMLGNAWQESSMNPNEAGGGLWQQISNFGQGTGGSLLHQMQVMLPQIESLRGALNAAGSPGAAATIFMDDFERPNMALANLPNRIAGANQAYAQGYARGGKVRYAGAFGGGGVVAADRPTMALFGDKGPETAMFIPHGQEGMVYEAGDIAPGTYSTSSSSHHHHTHHGAKIHYTTGFDRLTGQVETHTTTDWQRIHAEIAQQNAAASAAKKAFDEYMKGQVTDTLLAGGAPAGTLDITRRQASQYGLPGGLLAHGGGFQVLGPGLSGLTTSGFSHVQTALGKELSSNTLAQTMGADPAKIGGLLGGLLKEIPHSPAAGLFRQEGALGGHLSKLEGEATAARAQRDRLYDKAMGEHGRQRRETLKQWSAEIEKLRVSTGHGHPVLLTQISRTEGRIGAVGENIHGTRTAQIIDQAVAAAAKGVAGAFANQQSEFTDKLDTYQKMSSLPVGTKMNLTPMQLQAMGLTPQSAAALTGGGKSAAAEQIKGLSGEVDAYKGDAQRLQDLYKVALKTHNTKLQDALMKQLDGVTKAEVQAYSDLAAAEQAAQQARVTDLGNFIQAGQSAGQHTQNMYDSTVALNPATLTGADRQALIAAGANPALAGQNTVADTTGLQTQRNVDLAGITQLTSMLKDPTFADPTARQAATDSLNTLTEAVVTLTGSIDQANAQAQQNRVSNLGSFIQTGTQATQAAETAITGLQALDPTRISASDMAALQAAGLDTSQVGGASSLTTLVKSGRTFSAGDIASAQASANAAAQPLVDQRSIVTAGIAQYQAMLNDPTFTDPTARQQATDAMTALQSSVVDLTKQIDAATNITQQEIDAINAQVAASQVQATQQQAGADILGSISNLAPGTDLSSLGLTPQVLAGMGLDAGTAAGVEGGGAAYYAKLQQRQGGELTPAQIAAAQASTAAINTQLGAERSTDQGTLAQLQAELPNLTGDAATNAQTQIATLIKSILDLTTQMNNNTDATQQLTQATNQANSNSTGSYTGTVGFNYNSQNYAAGGSQTSDDPASVTLGV